MPYLVDRYTVLTQKLDQTISTEATPEKYELTDTLPLTVGDSSSNEQGYNFQFAMSFFNVATGKIVQDLDRFGRWEVKYREFDFDPETYALIDTYTTLKMINCTQEYFWGFGSKAAID